MAGHRKWSITKRSKSALDAGVVPRAGTEQLTTAAEHRLIAVAHDPLYAVAEALLRAGFSADSHRRTDIPETGAPVTDESLSAPVIRLCEAREDNDDVPNVYSILDRPEEMLAKLSA